MMLAPMALLLVACIIWIHRSKNKELQEEINLILAFVVNRFTIISTLCVIRFMLVVLGILFVQVIHVIHLLDARYSRCKRNYRITTKLQLN